MQVIKTLAGSLFLLTTVSLFVFVLLHVLPGDPAQVHAAGHSSGIHNRDSRAHEEALRKKHGLDSPVLVQWSRWIRRAAAWPPDFGREFKTDSSIGDEIRRRLRVTIPLGLSALVIAYGLAIPLGLFGALFAHRWQDKSLGLLLFVLYSLPVFWVGSTLITLLCRQGWLDWFPLMGIRTEDLESTEFFSVWKDVAWHSTLPVICLTYGSLAFVARMTRTSVLEVVHSHQTMVAHAKGLHPSAIWIRHILRRSAIPLVTLVGATLPAIVTGSIIVETLFNLPGLGQYAWHGITMRDYNVAMATTMLASAVTLFGFHLSEWGYRLLDPRVRRMKG